jgi:hypothetical protein
MGGSSWSSGETAADGGSHLAAAAAVGAAEGSGVD